MFAGNDTVPEKEYRINSRLWSQCHIEDGKSTPFSPLFFTAVVGKKATEYHIVCTSQIMKKREIPSGYLYWTKVILDRRWRECILNV
jgi:hypothetical protein